jgi:hypothetical protein
MKGLAVVYRRTLEVSLHDQADEADQDQDEHRRGCDQRNRQDRAPDLSFARFPHLESSVKLTEASHGCRPAVERIGRGSTGVLKTLKFSDRPANIGCRK